MSDQFLAIKKIFTHLLLESGFGLGPLTEAKLSGYARKVTRRIPLVSKDCVEDTEKRLKSVVMDS